jgi:hypothetical protein
MIALDAERGDQGPLQWLAAHRLHWVSPDLGQLHESLRLFQ